MGGPTLALAQTSDTRAARVIFDLDVDSDFDFDVAPSWNFSQQSPLAAVKG